MSHRCGSREDSSLPCPAGSRCGRHRSSSGVYTEIQKSETAARRGSVRVPGGLSRSSSRRTRPPQPPRIRRAISGARQTARRSEEHTSELQSLAYLVCRLLLEKKKTKTNNRCNCKQSATARTTSRESVSQPTDRSLKATTRTRVCNKSSMRARDVRNDHAVREPTL